MVDLLPKKTTCETNCKGPTTKEKGTLFRTFFLFVAVEKLNILWLRWHVEILIKVYTAKLTVFTDFLKYLPRKMALLAKNCWEIVGSGGGGKGLSGRTTKKELFAASLSSCNHIYTRMANNQRKKIVKASN